MISELTSSNAAAGRSDSRKVQGMNRHGIRWPNRTLKKHMNAQSLAALKAAIKLRTLRCGGLMFAGAVVGGLFRKAGVVEPSRLITTIPVESLAVFEAVDGLVAERRVLMSLMLVSKFRS